MMAIEINRIKETFRELAAEGSKAFIAYLTGGYPNLAATGELVQTIASAGADVIEIGVPFSDPVADGAVIQRASQHALEAGTSLSAIISLVADIRKKTQVPLVLMSYCNPVFRFGIEEFARQASVAGVDGIIIPDLPFEEAGIIEQLLNDHGICLVPLIAPTSTEERMRQVMKSDQGFVYCVSVTGTTGGASGDMHEIADYSGKVRKYTKAPIALGFGISDPATASNMAEHADAVIVGSAIVKIIEEYRDDKALMKDKVAQFVRSIKDAI